MIKYFKDTLPIVITEDVIGEQVSSESVSKYFKSKSSKSDLYSKQYDQEKCHIGLCDAVQKKNKISEDKNKLDQEVENNLLKKYLLFKPEPYMDDINVDEISYFDTQLLSEKQLKIYYQLGERHNFNYMDVILEWVNKFIRCCS